MINKLPVNPHHSSFESIRHEDDVGDEFWSARELAKILEYSEYRHFQPVINKAKDACKNSELDVIDHFEDVLVMVDIGSGAQRKIPDVRLSRYACYLIVQNGDSAKSVIANDLSPKNSAIRLMRFPLNWDKRRSHHEEALQRRTNYPCY